MKLYRPSPSTGAVHVSSDALGDMSATVLPGGAVTISPPNSVLTRNQVRALATASDACLCLRADQNQSMPPGVELVEAMPPEDEIALSDDGVEAV
jgi:hypothetical protein